MTPQSLLAPARLARQPILRTQSDERLVDLVRAGYEPAFEAIVARYRRPLLRHCGRVLPEARAEDVVQQAFVSAYDAMRKGDVELNLRPWLYAIAHNAALSALRDRGLRYEQLDEGYDGVERPDQALERRQGMREVLAAVGALPERQRDAIVLRELEGRSYEEIAEELGVTGGAVRQLLHRARATLRSGATALIPVGLITRIPSGADGEHAGRVAEAMAGAGTGAVVAKVCTTALVTGAVAGGVAVAPDIDGTKESSAAAKESAAGSPGPPADAHESRAADATSRVTNGRDGSTTGRNARGGDSIETATRWPSGPGPSDSSGSGSDGDGDDDEHEDHSGPGGGNDDDDGGDNSGSGSGSSGPGDGSGSGSGDDGADRSGSSGSGGEGSSGSGGGDSGEDSDSSGSGSEGTDDLSAD